MCDHIIHEIIWALCVVAGKLVFGNHAAKDLLLTDGCRAKVPVFEAGALLKHLWDSFFDSFLLTGNEPLQFLLVILTQVSSSILVNLKTSQVFSIAIFRLFSTKSPSAPTAEVYRQAYQQSL